MPELDPGRAVEPQKRHTPYIVQSRRVHDGFRRRYRVRCERCGLDIPRRTLALAADEKHLVEMGDPRAGVCVPPGGDFGG